MTDIKITNEKQCTVHLSGARSDIKQAVKELRDALADRAKDAEDFLGTGGMGEPPDDEPLLTASIRNLPAVLDRLEKVDDCGEEGACGFSPGCNRHWEERNRELVAERDAALAKFAELREAIQRTSDSGDCGQALEDDLARFPVEPEVTT